MKKSKLKPGVIAQIVAGRKAGATYKDLASRFRVSEGSIRNALISQGEPPKASTSTDAASPPEAIGAGPMTRSDLQHLLADHVRDLRDNLAKAKASGDQAVIASAARNLTQASTLLSRVTPAPPTEAKEGVFVTAAEMSALADSTLARLAKESASWPVCPTCKQPTPPVGP